ncbi:unnamed protein product, partial [Rotaria magnacalcarata]
MASVREAQISPSKIIQNGNHHISKVKFGLDNSHHIDDNHGSLDKILESSALSNN